MKYSDPSNPFDPADFRSHGHKLVDLLSDYLEEALNAGDMAVLPDSEPDDLTSMFSFESGGGENEDPELYFKRIIENSIHIHHPGYIGHQVTSPLPVTALAHLCTSLMNNGAAVYEMGPVNMAMEKNVINMFAGLLESEEGYDGIFTHGGSAGNLTAMLAARQNMTGYNIWEEGVRESEKPAFLVSELAHYSVGRTVRIMGLGAEAAVRVPVDDNYRMNTRLLDSAFQEAAAKGLKIIGVVASACSTATGTYDDLEEIADFCEKNNLWMHVDGAHGMGVLFSEKYKSLVKGINRADSVVIDFHKMFLTPALNTLVMFRNGEKSYETFAQKASYLFRQNRQNEWYNSALRTLECTKSALGTIAYTALKYHGSYYKEYIESRYDLARKFADKVSALDDLEIAVKPQSNIVCFRYAPKGYTDEILNAVNASARSRIIREGSFYVVQVEIDKKIWIRVTIINPLTGMKELDDLIDTVTEMATSALQQGKYV